MDNQFYLKATDFYAGVEKAVDLLLAAVKNERDRAILCRREAIFADSEEALAAVQARVGDALAEAEAVFEKVMGALEGEEHKARMKEADKHRRAVLAECENMFVIADGGANDALADEAEKMQKEIEKAYAALCRAVREKTLWCRRYHMKAKSAYDDVAHCKFDPAVQARMYILGDSTVCHREETDKVQGWADAFEKHVKPSLAISNLAQGGWSFKGMKYTVSSQKKGEYENFTDPENSRFGRTVDVATEGDFVVFASTSPNDLWQHGYDFYYTEDKLGRVTTVEEGTPRAKKYTWTAPADEYYTMLRDCIEKTLDVGATPVLVTACGGLMLTEEKEHSFTVFGKEYTTARAIPGKITSCVEHYEEVKRMLAKEFEGKVILIDYAPLVFLEYEKTFDAAIASGMTREDALTHLRGTYNASETDPTHQNAVGAALAAEKILAILRDPTFDCALKAFID